MTYPTCDTYRRYRSHGWAARSPLLLLALAHAADFLLTWAWLRIGGQEGNPFAAAVIASWGLAAIIPVKLANLGSFWLIAILARGTPLERPSRILIWAGVGILAAAVLWNLTILTINLGAML